ASHLDRAEPQRKSSIIMSIDPAPAQGASEVALADESAARARQDESDLNEEHLRALVQALSTFTWFADADGKFSTAQPGWQSYTGHDFPQHGHSGWIQDVHPEDRERVSDI